MADWFSAALQISRKCGRYKIMEALHKELALVLWGEDENGEDDVAVFSGVLIFEEGTYFLRRKDCSSVEIIPEWLERIRPVPESMKEILLNCEYQLPLSIASIDKADDSLAKYGNLKWPE